LFHSPTSENQSSRFNFNEQITETSEEYELKTQLDEQLRSVTDKYKYKRRQIRELQEDLQVRFIDRSYHGNGLALSCVCNSGCSMFG